MKKTIVTNNAPAAVGPYAQAVEANGFVFTSGQLPMEVGATDVVEGIEKQTHLVIKNIIAVLEAAQTDLSKVVKATIFLANFDDFATVNEIYASYFEDSYPARSAYEVGRLPKDALVEIEVIAYK